MSRPPDSDHPQPANRPMQTHVDPDISADPALAAAIQRATPILESVVEASADLVRAEWGLGRDERGRPLILLRLSDFTGSVVGHFAPDELSMPGHLRIRLYRLWGDLLQERSHKQLERVKSLLNQIEGAGVGQD